MPNTLTSIFTSTPASEPVDAAHPNTATIVQGTQLGNGTWQVIHTAVTKTTTPPTITGRLRNFPAITASIVASGNVLDPIATRFVVLAGQSNALGVGYNSELAGVLLASGYVSPARLFANTRIFNQATQAIELLDNRSTGGVRNNQAADNGLYTNGGPRTEPCFGLESALALRSENAGHSVSWVKHTRDGGSIDLWSASTGGTAHNALLTAFNNAKTIIQAQGQTPQVDAFIWVQGEADAGTAGTYQSRLSAMMQFFKTNGVIQAGTKIMVVGNANGTLQAQKQAYVSSEPQAFFVDTTGFQTRQTPAMDAGVHYDARGQLQIADAGFNSVYGVTGTLLGGTVQSAQFLRLSGGGISVVPNNNALSFTDNFDIAWDYRLLGTAAVGTYLFSCYDGQDMWAILHNQGGFSNTFEFFSARIAGLVRVAFPSPVSDNNWHRYRVGYDGATLRFYVDGALVKSTAISFVLPAPVGTPSFYVATRPGAGAFMGDLDNVVLTKSAAITGNYNFDNATAGDTSGQAGNGVLSGGHSFQPRV